MTVLQKLRISYEKAQRGFMGAVWPDRDLIENVKSKERNPIEEIEHESRLEIAGDELSHYKFELKCNPYVIPGALSRAKQLEELLNESLGSSVTSEYRFIVNFKVKVEYSYDPQDDIHDENPGIEVWPNFDIYVVDTENDSLLLDSISYFDIPNDELFNELVSHSFCSPIIRKLFPDSEKYVSEKRAWE